MSHYCVYVFHDEDTSVEYLLYPYDENLELEKPIVYLTKQGAIEHCRKYIEDYKNTIYKEYLENPEKYEEEYSHNPKHIKYLKEEFPKRLEWTDEQCYDYEKEDYEVDEDGNLLTTENPNSKWDWYEVGGRWSGTIPNNEVEMKDVDIDKVDCPYAFITPNGEWVERGQMGWFGMASNEKDKEDCDKIFRDYLKTLDKKIILTQVDCHI